MDELKKALNPAANYVGIFIGAMSAALYDLFHADMGLPPLGALAILTVIMGVGAALIVVASLAKRRISHIIVVSHSEIHPALGLIVLASLGPAERMAKSAAAAAINYHLNTLTAGRPTLKHCWLIATAETRANAEHLAAMYAMRVQCHIEIIEDGNSILDTYDKVREIYHRAHRWGLKPQEIAADCTGGTALMSVGMGLALVSVHEQSLEYIPAVYKSDGSRDFEAQPDPQQVSIEFGAAE